MEEFKKRERKSKVNPKKLYIIDIGYPKALDHEFSMSQTMEKIVLEYSHFLKTIFFQLVYQIVYVPILWPLEDAEYSI
ncbi:hypothetical protein SUSAZ_09160 [Sulfolobus acidocaldarius SUSAZ]|nr:hypothetical protein SUSAZ_09160 [Sulfolobus acidocaldarius SUSAZ]